MHDPADIPVPIDASTGPAFVSGVIEALYTAHQRAWGIGDGKTFHNEQPDSEAEAAHAKGQEYACVRMLVEGNQALERRGAGAVQAKAPHGAN